MRNQIIIDSSGIRWLVAEAVNEEEAQEAITFARVSGSVGSKTTVYQEHKETILADVYRIDEQGNRIRDN